MEILVGKTAGFCYGVKRAVEGANNEVTKNKKTVYGLGEIVHNHEVIQLLEDKGMEFVDDINLVKDKVLIRAHGIEKNMYELAKKKNIEVIDYTCPNVLKIHQIVEQYSKQGYFIFLMGDSDHPENKGTISYCGNHYFVLKEESQLEEAIKKFQNAKLQKGLVISQTTFHFEKFKKMVELLQQKLSPLVTLEVKNTICNATQIRQKETEEIAKKVDGMIIIGGKHSSNTQKLYQIACQYCQEVVGIETAEELEVDTFKGKEKIGIMAGASTPEQSIKKVIEKIEKRQKEMVIC